MDSIKCVSSHAEPLADGRLLAPGQVAHDVDLSVDENQRLLDEGKAIKVANDSESEPPQLAGEALEARCRELEIEGWSNLNAEDRRAAVSEAEAKLAEDDNNGGNA